MSVGKSPFLTHFFTICIAGVLLSLLTACGGVRPRNFPANKPFVFKYSVNVEGNLTKDEKTDLEARLVNQLDDSIKVRTVGRFFYKGLYRQVLNNPPVYSSDNADKSVIFIKSLLNSLGYFNDTTSYIATVDSTKADSTQLPTTIEFTVKPGKLVTLDSISYNIRHPELQVLTNANLDDGILKKGGAFAKGNIGAELDRLVELYRNNGYLRFTRDELVGIWDTLDVALLLPSLDPFEQLEVLQLLKERRENPTANLEIRLRPGFDTTRLVKYFVGNVNIYPDYGPDTIGFKPVIAEVDTAMYVIQYAPIDTPYIVQFGDKAGLKKLPKSINFKPKVFPINIYLKNGRLYRQRTYQRTLNRLTQLGTWKLISTDQKVRTGQDTVDFYIRLTPSQKYLFSANLEASQNQTAISGNLFGFGITTGVQNRNFAKALNLATTNVRYNVELGNNFVQTRQFSVSHNIYFPRPIPNMKWIPERLRDEVRSVFSFTAANTERYQLFNLTTINGSWGYEFQRTVPRTNRTILVSLKIPNIEYSYLRKRDSLQKLIDINPALDNIFTDGFIASTIAGVTFSNSAPRWNQILAGNVELSGFPASLIPSKFLDSQLYRFVKFNVEFTRLMKMRNSSIAVRAFAGVGYEFNSTVSPDKKNSLPFFKQYFAGGPNSMRAWRLRRLGPGSAIKNFNTNPERYGDVQLEVNAEYRFTLANVSGVKIESALFTDIGNIWYLKEAAGAPEEVFNFGRLGKDIAVGLGTGLRVDFTFFLIRLDYAYKVKDPSPDVNNAASQNKLFYNWKPFNGQVQLGINYPFKL